MARLNNILTNNWFLSNLPASERQVGGLYTLFGIILLGSLFLAIVTEQYYLAGLPAFVLLLYLSIVDFQKVFYLLLICIPLSTEAVLPNGFGLDLPTEPLMVGLMAVFFLFNLRHGRTLSNQFFRHPISLLLLLHLGWVLVTTITSQSVFVSFKFLLAKLWYVTTFYYLAGRILKTEKAIRTFFWCILLPMLFTIVVTLVRHSAYGFSFEDVYRVLHPFYRNHVAYASIMSLFIPFVWFARYWYPKWSFKWWFLLGCIPFLLLAVQLSYTRAAYVGIVIAIGVYFIIRFRQMKIAVGLASIGIVVGLSYFLPNNKYLEYAPEFEKTITHTDFDNLVEATYKMQDVSTMERFYRWIAGFRMVGEQPIFGFGPGNFYFFYKTYTVTSFKTYVSKNPEKSGIHSYYLMIAVEQGIVGALIFLSFSFYVLIKGEMIYHQTIKRIRKHIVMAALLSIVVIDSLLIINDLIETDKVGTLYFICLALIVNVDLMNRRDLKSADSTLKQKAS